MTSNTIKISLSTVVRFQANMSVSLTLPHGGVLLFKTTVGRYSALSGSPGVSAEFLFYRLVSLDVKSPSIKTGNITVLQNNITNFEIDLVTIQLCNSVVQNINYSYYSTTSCSDIRDIRLGYYHKRDQSAIRVWLCVNLAPL